MSTNTNYSVGYNMPGYLPESEPTVCSNIDEAKRLLIGHLLRWADDVDDEVEAEDMTAAAEDVNLWSGSDTVYAAGLAWWIQETDEDLEDEDDPSLPDTWAEFYETLPDEDR
jgi:hypothetical protein